MANAKEALYRVASLSRSDGGLPINLMRGVVVAAVTSLALYGWEVWWRGQQDRMNKLLQALLNNQARAITGLLKSTPLVFLQCQACLPGARDLLNRRQTRYAVRALNTDGEYLTHQLLPVNFRLDGLYDHRGGTTQSNSTGWTRPEMMHQLFGSKVAQQVMRHVDHDTEHSLDLPCRQKPLVTVSMVRMYGLIRMPIEMLPDRPLQKTLFVELARDVSGDVGAARKERNG